MTEYPELFEKIDRLDREMDVQAALIESLVDKVDGLVETVLELGRVKDASRSRSKPGRGTRTPSKPSDGECDARSAC